MAVKKGSSHLLGNSAWNATAFAVAVLLNLAILPFVISRLGLAAFGVAGLVTACLAPALMFSNALGLSMTRELAQRLEPSDRDAARRFFATALALAIVMGGLIAVSLGLAGGPLARLGFHLGGPAADDLGLAFAWAASGWLCQCLFAVFLAPFTARQDYRRIAAISITGTVVTTVSMLLLIPLAPRASTFLACQAVGFATNLLMALAWSRCAIRDCLARPALDRGALRALAKLGGWQFAAQSGALFAGQADRYLLGALLQPQFVGFYSVAQRLEEAIYIGVLKIGEVLFPFFGSLQKEDDDRKVDLLLRSSWVLNVLAASALGGLVPVAGALLYRWTGAEVAAETQLVLVVLAISGILGSSANVFAFYLLSQGRSSFNALISVVTGIFTMATSAVALPHFGWQAAGWSSCVGMVAQMVITVLLLRRTFRPSAMWSRMVHFILIPLGTGVAVALALRLQLGQGKFDHAPSWWYVVSLYGVSAAAIFVAAVAVSQLGPYRAVCWRDLRVIITRLLLLKAV